MTWLDPNSAKMDATENDIPPSAPFDVQGEPSTTHRITVLMLNPRLPVI